MGTKLEQDAADALIWYETFQRRRDGKERSNEPF